MVTLLWKENFGGKVQASAEPKPAAIEEAAVEAAAPEAEASTGGQNSGKLVQEATKAMLEDKKILLVGAVQVSISSSSHRHRHRHRHRRRRRHRHRHLMRACSLCMCRTHTHARARARARAPTHTVPLPSSLTPVRAGRPCSPFVASLLHPRRARLCSRAPCTFSCCSGRQPSRPRSAPA